MSEHVSDNSEPADAAIEEYLRLIDAGVEVDRSAFIASHPEAAKELRSFFGSLSMLQKLAGPGGLAHSDGSEMMARSEGESVDRILSEDQGVESRLPWKSLPAMFGRYRVESLLGKGAMGAVYRAHDTQLDRPVALKLSHLPEDIVFELRERMLQEARAAAALSNPHICRVYDVGEIGGTRFIAMELIEGRALADYIRSGRLLPIKTAVVIIRKLALALKAAHDKGVVHRDLKPTNVIINADHEPILMDFGLAQRPFATGEERLTKAGMLIGSPAYMSPEQARADGTAIGPASDIYSLGVVFYELLTGQLPFTGSVMTILAKVLSDVPPTPQSIRPEIDRHLSDVCHKMLAKCPDKRFASMGDVAETLQSWLKSLAKSSRESATKSESSTKSDARSGPTQDQAKSSIVSKPESVGSAMPRSNQDDFDGYRKWLGITSKIRPPSHYELLKISLDEDDHDVIKAAAEQRRHYVESQRGQGYDDSVAEIAYRINEAEITLLNNEMRREYDRQLDLFEKRRKNRQVDPFAPMPRIKSRPGRVVGEDNGIVKTFAGIVAVLCIAFAGMSIFAFNVLPWSKQQQPVGALPVAQPPAPVPVQNAPAITEKPKLVQNPGLPNAKAFEEKQQAGPSTPNPTTSVDLLKRIKINEDTISGSWAIIDGALETTNNAVCNVFLPLPEDKSYRLEIEGRRLHGDTGMFINVASFGRFCVIDLERGLSNDKYSGLGKIDGLSSQENRSNKPGIIFQTGKTTTIVVDVRPKHISAKVDGHFVIDWHGDFQRLTAGGVEPRATGIGSWTNKTDGRAWNFSKIVLSPIPDTEPLVEIPASPAAPVAQSPNGLTNNAASNLINVPSGGMERTKTGEQRDLEGATQFEGHYYKVFRETMGWKMARARCKAMGGHLATISSEAENTFITSLAKKTIGDITNTGVWLGATDERSEGQWEWIDGTPFTYSAWFQGQPNNGGGKDGGEHYLFLLLQYRGSNGNEVQGWCDQPNESKVHTAYFACEWETKAAAVLKTPHAVDNGHAPEGFESLFNGTDFTNWSERKSEHWSVANGILRYDGKGANAKNLVSAKEYGDFELLVDWKIEPGGDSGIYLRGKPQVQIKDDATGSGGLYNNKTNPKGPRIRADKPAGEWNTFRIVMRGERVTVTLNGQLVVDNVVMENYPSYVGSIPSRGPIELQQYTGAAEFRNIFVRELTQSPVPAHTVDLTTKPVPASEQQTPFAWQFTATEAKATQDRLAKSLGKNVIVKNSLGMEFVLIPPGTFMMGSPLNEKDRYRKEDQVKVTLTKPFWLGKTEVTQGQWHKVMGTTPWKGKDFVKVGSSYPASFVGWEHAQEFVKKLSKREGVTYRLPTEAEWEWSCRAGTSSRWSFGENETGLGQHGWYGAFIDGGNAKSAHYAHEVGKKLANPFGLYDMYGNVWEWCEDEKAEKLPGGTNPIVTNGSMQRVFKGGSWHDGLRGNRSAVRSSNWSGLQTNNVGFRVLRTQ